jgi:murein DD-endopeptidase MepM/ murein hydrolase activator NlpD
MPHVRNLPARSSRSGEHRLSCAFAPLLRATVTVVATVVIVQLATGSVAVAAGCLRPPVDVPIVRPFDAPPCQWCAGHRGVTFAVAPGTPVRAAAAGTVTFSGVVVDIRYVVVRHADGLLATYGGLDSTTLQQGATLAAGSTIGRSGPELYFGLRTGPDTYIDPEPLLGELVVRPYLVPTDGSAPRPPPPPVLRCDADGSSV